MAALQHAIVLRLVTAIKHLNSCLADISLFLSAKNCSSGIIELGVWHFQISPLSWDSEDSFFPGPLFKSHWEKLNHLRLSIDLFSRTS